MHKKLIVTVIMFIVMTCCVAGCSSSAIDEETTTKSKIVPKLSLVVNDKKEDTQNPLKVFPVRNDREMFAYAHYYITSDNEEETIRIKVESQWGTDETIKEDFKVESDEIVTIKANQWNTEQISTSASNLYFHRITIYYGEEEIVLGTSTIYTPYEAYVYDESDCTEEPPEFHPYNKLLDDEQEFYDNCSYAVVDYAKRYNYCAVSNIIGWQAENYLYLYVEYIDSSGGYETGWFSIDNANVEFYDASENSSVIPEDEGTVEQNVLDDYYYVEEALSKAIA